jgi:hypothetical protein
MDCSGYLTSFVRRTEAFALVEPGTPINDFGER